MDDKDVCMTEIGLYLGHSSSGGGTRILSKILSRKIPGAIC
jgi:hypothetical protein